MLIIKLARLPYPVPLLAGALQRFGDARVMKVNPKYDGIGPVRGGAWRGAGIEGGIIGMVGGTITAEALASDK